MALRNPSRRAAAASWLALALLGASLLSTCQASTPQVAKPSPSQSAASKTLRVRLAYPPKNLDPGLAASEAETAVVRQIWEPLLRPAPGLAGVEPAAAQGWEASADGLSYRFQIRPAHYSDGQPVRAQDFVFAWRRIIDPRLASPVAALFAAVVKGGEQAEALDPVVDAGRIDPALAALGLAAPDDATFQITLPRPAAQLPWIATLPQGAPLRQELVASGRDWATHPENLVGNGAFKSGQLETGRRIGLVANPGYWAGAPALAGLDFEILKEDAEAKSRFDAGQLDIAELATADPGPRQKRLTQPELTTFWIDMNTARPPLDSLGVRQALAAAVDRQALVASLPAGRASALGRLVPSGLPGSDVGAAAQGFDPARARNLLQAAGGIPAQLSPLSVLVGPDPVDAALARALATQLEQNLGIKLQVEAVDPEKLAQRRYLGDWQLTGPIGWTADYPDARSWLDLFRGLDGANLAHWRNPRYDLLVAQAGVEADPARRVQLYSQAGLILLDEAPALFLYQRQRLSLVRPSVRNLTTSPLDEWPGSLNAAKIRIG